jgi:hypothetical protein
MDTQANEPSAQTDSGQEAGLLDGAVVADEQGQQVAPESTAISHTEPQEDDTPLERPDWWPENFWKKDESAPDLEAIAKSWTDLRKQISQGKHKPPADGKYDTTAFGDIPENDPVRTHVLGWAQEYGVSQAALDKLVGEVVSMSGEQQDVVRRSIEQERTALGPNADAIIKGMVEWGSGLVRKGVWGKDDFEEFKIMGGTAQGIKALMKLREAYEGTRIPTNSVPVEGAPSKEELYAMVADPKYKSDAAYRAKVERMFQQNFS